MPTVIEQLKQVAGVIPISTGLRDLLTGIFHDRLQPKAIAFSYLASRTFGVIRYPTRPDRSAGKYAHKYGDAARLLDSYTDQQWTQLEADLRAAYTATQVALTQVFPTGVVKLERAVAPLHHHQHTFAARECDDVALFPKLALAAQIAGQQSICLDFDIVSGWSTTALNRYGCLEMSREWPITDVIVISDLLGLSGPLEDDEWLCLNRNPRGMLELPIHNLRINPMPAIHETEVRNHKDVQKLAQELQLKANMAPAERGIALRPVPSLNACWRPKNGLLISALERLLRKLRGA